MKTFLITLFTITSLYFNQETETVIASFTGYTEDTYYFEDEDELIHSFEAISEDAASKFDLTNNEFVGKKFKITYIVTSTVNEDDEEYDVISITGLDLIQ